MSFIAVIIPAAGRGVRFGGDGPKQFALLPCGTPVLARTIAVFQAIHQVGEIALAIPAGYEDAALQLVGDHAFTKVKHILAGGESRAHSVYEGLKRLAPTDVVLVHDGVRPFVSEQLVLAVAEAAQKHGAAIAGIPFVDTVKETDINGYVCATPDRNRFWCAQTPQGFNYDQLLDAYEYGVSTGLLGQVTDDSTLVEAYGGKVFIVPGERSNIKITTPEDMPKSFC